VELVAYTIKIFWSSYEWRLYYNVSLRV